MCACEFCDPDSMLRTDESPNSCQVAEEMERNSTACWDCGKVVTAGAIWVGQRTGTALCDRCHTQWVGSGRAKMDGQF